MVWFKCNQLKMALMLAAAIILHPHLIAQLKTVILVTITDKNGSALHDASVLNDAGQLLGRTDANGQLSVACAVPCRVRVSAVGFAEKNVLLATGTTINLEPVSNIQNITVTAYRTPLSDLESPATTRLLSESAVVSTAAVTLDGELRQVPGVELFRRSSSLVANPASQGISLRGLGSTSASRTLVVEDDVPMNDAFGGWIHWEEQPELALKGVEVLRGGASDLYGSSAIGGVINLLTVHPNNESAEVKSSYGSEGTYDDSFLGESKRGPWGVLASGGTIGTDGYIQEAPAQRGPVDIASYVHSQNGMTMAERGFGTVQLSARVSGFNEARSNGTPDQTNGTRVWRYSTGSTWSGPHDGTLLLKLYGSTQHYRQTFSSINNLPTSEYPNCNYRCGETLTRFSHTPDNELGAVTHWTQPFKTGLLLLAGADVHDVRVWDNEQTYGPTSALTNLHDHQRDAAVYSEILWIHKSWTITAAGRIDWYQNYDGFIRIWQNATWIPDPSQPAQESQQVFDPRMGVARKLGAHWAVTASGFRAFRAPTPNELYRSTQVGNQLTIPNGSLLSERATGWETGLATQYKWGSIRASYFLTQVNRPITAVTINPSSSPILLERENLGQIESRGVAVDYQLVPRPWLVVDGGYQFAVATVTNAGTTSYLGNWIAEVARNLATTNLRAYKPKFGTLSMQSRISGRQYDDAANTALLHGYFRMDVYASHNFGKRYEFFAAGENIFNRQIEVAKTPTTTLAMPRVARVGISIKLGALNN
jgi:outer membrane receptor protein involved in Fe transport